MFIETVLIAFGRLGFEAVSFATRYSPAISTATTVAGALTIASGITLILQENDFISTDPITPWVFAISGIAFSGGMSLQTLNMTTGRVVAPLHGTRNGTLLTGAQANAQAAQNGFPQPPFSPISAARGQISASADLVRVYNPTVNNQAGAWSMPRSEIAGLTPQEIQAKFSLSYTPTVYTKVNADGLNAVSGIAGRLNGQPGGGLQIEILLGQRAVFTDPRPLPVQ